MERPEEPRLVRPREIFANSDDPSGLASGGKEPCHSGPKQTITCKMNRLNRDRLRNRLETEEISNALPANSTGVLDLCAHIGQEATEYSRTTHSVIWVEGDPRNFRRLKRNISKFPNQIAGKALPDERERDVRFWRKNNYGASSSVFPLAQNHGYKSIGLAMVGSRKIRSTRLDQLLSGSQLSHFDHWVLGLRGSELRALRWLENTCLLPRLSRSKFRENLNTPEECFALS